MLIKEFRITMPMTVEEYQVGMLYSVVQASLDETGGGEGVEVLHNAPYENVPLLNGKFNAGQYTKKIYHLDTKVPSWVKYIAPSGSLQLEEEAWNATQYCKTVITNPGYMKDAFTLKLETYCLPDRGQADNVHELTPDLLAKRDVVHIDIANDPIPNLDEAHDPTKYQSSKPDPPRGPLGGNWKEHVTPVMTVYKLITIEFKWFGLQSNMESFMMNYEQKLFNRFHRQIFCCMDKWFGMTIEDIRALEDKTKDDLEKARNCGEKRGTIGIE